MKNPRINLAHASPKKSLSEMTPNERLVFALYLGLTAPTDALRDEVGETAEEFAIGLSSAAVESCKAIALAKYQAHLTSENPDASGLNWSFCGRSSCDGQSGTTQDEI